MKASSLTPATDRLTIWIIGIYYLVLVGLVFCLVAADAQAVIRLTGVPQYSQDWQLLIYGVYYVFPVIFGVGFGLTFKPFWRNFRNVTVIIFILHFLYSGIVYVVRLNAEAQWQENIHLSGLGQLSARNFRSQFIDEPLDGFIDKIHVDMEADTSRLNPGAYSLTVHLFQAGQPLPDGKVDVYKFEVGEKGNSIIPLSFDLAAGPLNKYFTNGSIDIDLELKKTLMVPAYVSAIIFGARWAPFLKTVSWEGYDPVLKDQVLDIQKIKKVGSFYLIPINPPR